LTLFIYKKEEKEELRTANVNEPCGKFYNGNGDVLKSPL
jgi:hypothetical protein